VPGLRASRPFMGSATEAARGRVAKEIEPDLKEFVHERFRRTDEKLDRLIDYMVTMIERQASVERQTVGLREDVARLDGRMDRIDRWLDRIEKRLDLHDPAVPGGG
jgi:hypothetical protein